MEKYDGPKFKTVFLSKKPVITSQSTQLIKWFRKFHEIGLAPEYGQGSSGNLSFRYKNGFIIKPTKTFFSSINPEDLVFVKSFDFKKGVAYVHGKHTPSTELQMHKIIYDHRKDINAVFHIHDFYLMNLDEAKGIPITAVTEAGTEKIGHDVLRMVDDKKLVIMKDHGIVSIGKTINEAGQVIIKHHKTKI